MATITGGGAPNVSFTLVGPLGTNPSANIPEVLSLASFLSYGTGIDQVAKIHAKTYVLAASTPQTVDLQSLTDIAGNAISFNTVNYFLYRIQATNDAYAVTFGGAGANEWNGFLSSGSTFVAQPSTAGNDGFAVIQAPNATGMAVGSGSRLLKVNPGSNAVGNIDLIIVGR